MVKRRAGGGHGLAVGGPYTRLRGNTVRRHVEGLAMLRLVWGQGLSIRQAAAQLDLSPTTAWRRLWWAADMHLMHTQGCKRGPVLPQRGTRRVPNGRPPIPGWDDPCPHGC